METLARINKIYNEILDLNNKSLVKFDNVIDNLIKDIEGLIYNRVLNIVVDNYLEESEEQRQYLENLEKAYKEVKEI